MMGDVASNISEPHAKAVARLHERPIGLVAYDVRVIMEDDYGRYETVEDGYWDTIYDGHTEYYDMVRRTWYGSRGGYVMITFRDGRVYDFETYGF